jgi:hypothetical protein
MWVMHVGYRKLASQLAIKLDLIAIQSVASAECGHEPTTTVADEKHLGCRLTGKRRRTAERGPRLSVVSGLSPHCRRISST